MIEDSAVIPGFVRYFMAAMVLLAGIHCGCAPCFADGRATTAAKGMEEMACCRHEMPADSSRHDSVPHHMAGDHGMACVAGDSSVGATMGKDLAPMASFIAVPLDILNIVAGTPTIHWAAHPVNSPSARDGGTLLRLHCALTV